MQTAHITCPHCQTPISLDDALTSQIRASMESALKQESQKELAEIKKKYEEEQREVRERIERELKMQIEEDAKRKQTELTQQLETEKKKRIAAEEKELQVLKKEAALEEATRKLELEVERKLVDERRVIREKTETELLEAQRQKDLEKDKQIQDLKKLLEDAQRKANQGSQQTQGEVQELELERMLKDTFRDDIIEPVGKGVSGADIRQIVRSSRGTVCGTILWESKQTKSWSEGWIPKLKTDLRAEKADIPVIVTTAFHETNWCGMSNREGVWVCSFPLAISTAALLRKSLLDVGREKAMTQNRGDKADMIYSYVTSPSFRQQMEAIAEVYWETKKQIDRERAAMEKIWKARESQSQRIFMGLGSIYGTIQGLAGAGAVPELKGLELFDEEEPSPPHLLE